MKYKFLLTDTLIRDMTEEKDQILRRLEQNATMNYAIKFVEEPGEILNIRIMPQQELEEAVREAISKLFPGKKVSDIVSQDVILQFKIYN